MDKQIAGSGKITTNPDERRNEDKDIYASRDPIIDFELRGRRQAKNCTELCNGKQDESEILLSGLQAMNYAATSGSLMSKIIQTI